MGLFGRLFNKKEDVAVNGKEKVVCSPLDGEVIPLSEVGDPAFAGGMMGQGVGILPTSGKLLAPVDGEIAAVFPTGHALGIRTDNGMELMLHIGIDTVELDGKGFKAHIKEGDQIRTGDLLVEFDIEEIVSAGYKVTTMVLVSNAKEMGEMKVLASGHIAVSEKLFAFRV